MTEPIILCEDLWHVYPGDVVALRQANLTVQPGQVVGVVGQNGSGKTTLVKHFNGLLKPTNGKVVVNGVDTREKPVHELARHVGYVFQNPNHQLFATTVRAELAFGPRNFGLSQSEIEERIDDTVAFFQIEDLLEHHPYRLSFPLRKLVAMASIYAMNPAVFVLDEPTTGQDHRGSNLVRRLIKKLEAQGKTVIVVSHDMALIAEVTDQLVVLWSSDIIAIDKPGEVFGRVDVMERTKLHPPQIFRFCQEWSNGAHKLPLALTVAQTADALTTLQG